MSISRHRSTHEIHGDTITFYHRNTTRKQVQVDSINSQDELNLEFNFIQLNSKWRMNLETETLSIEKYNSETKEYDKKFVLE